MSSVYAFTSRRGAKRVAQYWTPRVINGVIQNSSLPAKRNNSFFEIIGMTVDSATIGGFTVNNGDFAVFNSEGVLIEVLGDDEVGGGGSSTPFEGFLDTWTPATLPGLNITFSEIVYTFAPIEPVISEDGLTVTYPYTEGEGAGGIVSSAEVLEPFTGNNGVYYKVSAPNSAAADSGVMYGMSVAGDPDNLPPSSNIAGLAVVDDNNFMLINLGNLFGDDDFEVLNEEMGDLVPWTEDAIYCVSFNPDVGAYGTTYFYASTVSLTEPVRSYAHTAPTLPPTGIVSYVSAMMEMSTTIVNNPTVSFTGVNNLGGGEFDESSYPTEPNGKGYTITGLTSGIVHPEKGLLLNGDMVFFNSAGELAGVMMGRSNLVNAGVDLATVQEMIDAIKSDIGSISWTPTMITEPIDYSLAAGGAGYGSFYSGVNSQVNNYQRDLIDSEGLLSTNGSITPILYTANLVTGTPETLEGIYFQMPDPTDYRYTHNSTTLNMYVGLSDTTDVNGPHSLYAVIDLIDGYGSTSYPEQSFGSGYGFWARGLSDGSYGSVNGVLGEFQGGFVMNDTCFIGFGGGEFVFRNVTQGWETRLSGAIYQDTYAKRFVFAIQNSNTSSPSHQTSSIKARILADQTGQIYPFFSGGVPTNDIDMSAAPSNRHNKSVEIQGLTSPAYADAFYVNNGNILIFNSNGELISVLGN